MASEFTQSLCNQNAFQGFRTYYTLVDLIYNTALKVENNLAISVLDFSCTTFGNNIVE